ncbi:LysE family translocator [Termitidicoccus mucosus]|uniref:LysE family translocator n=1 Tax=Termitidicoccus mucosus TaxID=1184151 RepID=UPI003182DB26
MATLLGILTVGLVSPGPDFFLVLKNSMSGSRSRAFATGIGIAVGLTMQVVALSLGLAVAPPVVLRCIQLAGAGVLIWLGLRALLSRPAPVPPAAIQAAARATAVGGATPQDGPDERRQAMAGFMEGFLCNATNVKVFIFFVSIFSQFLPAGAPWQWRVAVPVIVVLHGAIMWSLITAALLSPPVASRLARAQRWLPRVFGVVLIGFAAFVIWEAARGAW